MHEYDAALKVLLQASTDSAPASIDRRQRGALVKRGNVASAEQRGRRIGLTAGDALVHLELQSTNDPDMGAIREILGRIASLEQPARRDALAQF